MWNIIRHYAISLTLLLALSLVLSSCGGGGGSTTTSTPPPPTTARTGQVFVGGSAGVTQLSSLVAASASVNKASAEQQGALADAKVILTVIKPDGSQTTASTRTDSKGAYALQIDAKTGDTVTVNIERLGYSSYIKTITITESDFINNGDRRQFVVSGNLAQTAIISSVKSDGVFKAGGGVGSGYRFGLMRQKNGVQRAFSSSNEIRRAAFQNDGVSPELDINIPDTWAPNATAITAKLAAFDPSNITQRGMFPGEFVGIGGGTAATVAKAATDDQTAYQLESVSFFSADVTANNGGQLVTPARLAAAGASAQKAAAAGLAVVYKYIPENGCGAMKKYKDRDTVKPGVQIPIYTYNPNTGKWGYLGEGTLVLYNNLTGNYDTIAANDLNNDGADDAQTGLKALACGQKDYYFAIETTDWYTWWNLDYPLIFTEPKTICLSGTITDGNGVAIPGAFVEADGYGNGGSSYFYTYAGNDGSFSLDILLGENETLNNYRFTAYNYSEWPSANKDFSSTAQAFSSTKSCNAIGTISISDRLACRITGKLIEENVSGDVPLASTWVLAENSNYSYYNWAWTQSDGTFTMKSTCNEPITLWAWGEAISVNVNGNASGSEQFDTGSIVTLNNLKKINEPPQVNGWVSPNPAKVNETITLDAWAWDSEGDYPLSYKWIVSGSTQQLTTPQAAWTPTSAGAYTVTLLVSDSKGNGTTVNYQVEVSAMVNNPPVILWSWVQPGAGCNAQPTFYLNAYDPDGDPLTYSWDQGNPLLDQISGGFVPQTAVSGNITATVSDGKGGSVNTILSVPTAAAGVQIYYASAWPSNPQAGDDIVTLYAYADQNGVAVQNYSWSVLGPDGNTVSVTPVGSGDTSSVNFVPVKGGDYQVHVSVTGTCGGNDIAERSFTITASAPNQIRTDYTLALAGSSTVTSLEFVITLPAEFLLPIDASGQPLASSLQVLVQSSVSAINYSPANGTLRIGMIKADGFAINTNLLTISRVLSEGETPPGVINFPVTLLEAGDLNGTVVTGVSLLGAVTNTEIK